MFSAHSSILAVRVLLLSALGAALSACDLSMSSKDAGGSTAGGACTDPTPLGESGIFRCAEGYFHRAEAHACANHLPRAVHIEWPAGEVVGDAGGAGGMGGASGEPLYTTSVDACDSDDDCNDPLAFCVLSQTNIPNVCAWNAPAQTPNYARVCNRGCVVDADCGPYAVCVCGEPVGYCAPVSPTAGCHTDADCDGAALCLQNAQTDNFAPHTFACSSSDDDCDSDADCGDGVSSFCKMGADGHRFCEGRAVCGRPFLVNAEARLAASQRTHTWLSQSGLEKPGAVSGLLALRLSERWTEVGLMEHASIAAFARFALQLLSLGAPAELLEASNQAQVDETRHARMAFELASHYAGAPVGPGPLSLAGPVLDADWEHILRTTIEEGCIGEACASLEAAHASALCQDPVVSRVLQRIAEDEVRHAALAFRAVAWMLNERPSLRPLARRLFDDALGREPASSKALASAPRNEAERHGVLAQETLAACRAEALREVVAPCIRTLPLAFGEGPQARGAELNSRAAV